MESPEAITLMIAGAVLAAAIIVAIVHHYGKKRTEALEAAAKSMGLDFSRLPESQLLPSLSTFPLFSQGHAKKAINVLSGIADEIGISIFDYRYTTGGGQHQHVHSQTVVVLESSVLDLPPFSLKPQNVIHNIGKAFGYKDIDWDTHPEFSKKYLLRSKDEPTVRQVFTPDILEYYEARPGLSTEAGSNRLIFFRSSKKVKPENLPAFLKDGFHIYTLFREQLI